MEKPRQTFGQPNIYFIREKNVKTSSIKGKEQEITYDSWAFCILLFQDGEGKIRVCFVCLNSVPCDGKISLHYTFLKK